MIKGKILVVDDEEGMRVTLKKILTNRGYEVTTAEDFHEASYYLQRETFDTVVTDIILSDINGLELLRIIREKLPDLPTIMITGEPNIKKAVESIQLGAYDYLLKPITKENLPPIIAKAVEKKRLLEEKKRLEEEILFYRQNLEGEISKLKKFQNEVLHYSLIATAKTLAYYTTEKLKPPLTIVHDHLLYLQQHMGHKDDTKKYIKIMSEEIEVAKKIINDFHTIASTQNLKLQKENLHLLLEKALNLIYVPEKILIRKENPETVPLFLVDKDQIQYVLINLIDNALLAMPEGGELTITVRSRDQYLEMSFIDKGIGIPEQDQKKLFQPFFTTRPPRAGLGLYICKFILEKHHGGISFKSTKGKGSTFTIKLPLKM